MVLSNLLSARLLLSHRDARDGPCAHGNAWCSHVSEMQACWLDIVDPVVGIDNYLLTCALNALRDG